MEQAVGEDCGGGEEQADGLVAMEEMALGFAAGLALLLDVVRDEFVVHEMLPRVWLPGLSGSISE